MRRDEDEWANRYRRENRCAGNYIVQAPGELLMEELDSHLFPGLPHGGDQEIPIARLAAASGKRHVAGPGISDPIGSADEEDGFGIGGENDRDRSPEQVGVLVGGGVASGKALTKAGEPAGQCG